MIRKSGYRFSEQIMLKQKAGLRDHPEPGKRVRRGGQGRAGFGAVVVHLPDQRIDAVELQFVADEADEGDVEHCAIEIALEVEQEHFEQGRAIVEGRAAAEARHATEALGTASDPHRIDAVLEAAILVEADIGGWENPSSRSHLATGCLSPVEPPPP